MDLFCNWIQTHLPKRDLYANFSKKKKILFLIFLFALSFLSQLKLTISAASELWLGSAIEFRPTFQRADFRTFFQFQPRKKNYLLNKCCDFLLLGVLLIVCLFFVKNAKGWLGFWCGLIPAFQKVCSLFLSTEIVLLVSCICFWCQYCV